jgi:hypothetical protein
MAQVLPPRWACAMSTFITGYREAYDYAVVQARERQRIMQLAAGREYGKKGFHVRLAVQKPELRFGRDAEGEFISPSDPVIQRGAP